MARFSNFLQFFDQIIVEILPVLEYNDTRESEEGTVC